MKNGQLKLVVQFSRSHLACVRRRRARNSDFYNISQFSRTLQQFIISNSVLPLPAWTRRASPPVGWSRIIPTG